MKDLLEREIGGGEDVAEGQIQNVSERLDRIKMRLDKIAAGAHYVT